MPISLPPSPMAMVRHGPALNSRSSGAAKADMSVPRMFRGDPSAAGPQRSMAITQSMPCRRQSSITSVRHCHPARRRRSEPRQRRRHPGRPGRRTDRSYRLRAGRSVRFVTKPSAMQRGAGGPIGFGGRRFAAGHEKTGDQPDPAVRGLRPARGCRAQARPWWRRRPRPCRDRRRGGSAASIRSITAGWSIRAPPARCFAGR